MKWLKSLGISPLGWMIIIALGIYLVSVGPDWVANGPKPMFGDPLEAIQKWLESKR